MSLPWRNDNSSFFRDIEILKEGGLMIGVNLGSFVVRMLLLWLSKRQLNQIIPEDLDVIPAHSPWTWT
jgi:hypothetical protein